MVLLDEVVPSTVYSLNHVCRLASGQVEIGTQQLTAKWIVIEDVVVEWNLQPNAILSYYFSPSDTISAS